MKGIHHHLEKVHPVLYNEAKTSWRSHIREYDSFDSYVAYKHYKIHFLRPYGAGRDNHRHIWNRGQR